MKHLLYISKCFVSYNLFNVIQFHHSKWHLIFVQIFIFSNKFCTYGLAFKQLVGKGLKCQCFRLLNNIHLSRYKDKTYPILTNVYISKYKDELYPLTCRNQMTTVQTLIKVYNVKTWYYCATHFKNLNTCFSQTIVKHDIQPQSFITLIFQQ